MLNKVQQNILSEQFSLFNPVILGIGILIGVNFSFLWIFLFLVVIACILYKIKLLRNTFLLLSLGFYVAQTGGIFKTTFLINKQYLTQEYTLPFEATVKYIEETHPVMKNMRRIVFRDIHFKNKDLKLDFIKTAKMTCSVKTSNNIFVGDRVSVFGQLTPFKPSVAPFTFNPKQYYTLQEIDVTGVAFKIKKIGTTKHYDVFNKLRCTLTRKIIDKLGATIGGIASALITGDKSSISTDIREIFIKSGTAHVLAISGLHMSLVATMVYIILFRIFLYISHFWLRINPQIMASALTIVLTGCYLALSGFSPSATRAYIMTLVGLIGLMLGRGVISMKNVSFSALLILLIDSGALFSISFQLSFSAVVALVSFYEHYGNLLKHKTNPTINIFIYILSSFVTTIIATIATAPISIATFNRLSICGTLGNAIAIPMISFIVVPIGLLCIVTTGQVQCLLNIFAWAITKMVSILTICSNLPYTDIPIKSPQMMTLYTIVFGGIVTSLCKSKLRYIGISTLCISIITWIFEKNPVAVIFPNQKIVCYIKDGRFYTNSKRKGRKIAETLCRNFGYSNKIEYVEIDYSKLSLSLKDNCPSFIWADGTVKTLFHPMHPYAPILYISKTVRSVNQ